MSVDSIFPLEQWFSATSEGSTNAFSRRVGFLGGYSLGFLGSLSTLDFLFNKNRDLYDTFFQLAGKSVSSSLDDESLLASLDRLARLVPQSPEKLESLNFNSEQLQSPPEINISYNSESYSSQSQNSTKKLYQRMIPEGLEIESIREEFSLIDFARTYPPDLLDLTTRDPDGNPHDPFGNPFPISDELLAFWEKVNELLIGGDSGDVFDRINSELKIDFRRLFDFVSVGTTSEWVGLRAVKFDVWKKAFEEGNKVGKLDAITVSASYYVNSVIASAKEFSESTVLKNSPNPLLAKTIKEKLQKFKDEPKQLNKKEATDLKEDITNLIEEIKSLPTSPLDNEEFVNARRKLEQDFQVIENLKARFKDKLGSSPLITKSFFRKIYLIKVQYRDGRTYQFPLVTEFLPIDSELLNFSESEVNIIDQEIRAFSEAFSNLSEERYKTRYYYKGIQAVPTSHPNLKTFIEASLQSELKASDIVIESVESQVELLNPMYVAGICAAYAIATSWQGQDFLRTPSDRFKFYQQVQAKVNRLISETQRELEDNQALSRPLGAFNTYYVMGLRSLEFFAFFVSDQAAQVDGATQVINVLRDKLPEFFAGDEQFTSLEKAIAYVERGAVSVSQRLREQDAKIALLEAEVVTLRQEVEVLKDKLSEAESVIESQKQTIDELKQENDELRVAYDTLAGALDEVKQLLQEALEALDVARKELENLAKALLECEKKRLQAELKAKEWQAKYNIEKLKNQGSRALAGAGAGAINGAIIGGVSGAVVGGVLGGPIGGVVGGVIGGAAGAVIGGVIGAFG